MSIPPAWHPDPTGRHDHRWWDGTRWTEHVADAGVAGVDPLEGQSGAGSAGGQTGPTGGTGAPTGSAGDTGVAGSAAPGSSWAAPQSGSAPGDGGKDAATWSAQAPGSGGWGGSQPASGAPHPAAGSEPTATDGLAVAALVVGIVSVVSSFFLLGGIGGVVAIVLGAIAMARVRKSGRKGRGMAITGLVTGIVAVVIAVLIFAFFSRFATTFFADYQECLRETGGDEEYCDQQLEEQLERRFFGG